MVPLPYCLFSGLTLMPVLMPAAALDIIFLNSLPRRGDAAFSMHRLNLFLHLLDIQQPEIRGFQEICVLIIR